MTLLADRQIPSPVTEELPHRFNGAPRAKPVAVPCSSAESAEANPPTHEASEGYPHSIHPLR
jgi:hypothetical protein